MYKEFIKIAQKLMEQLKKTKTQLNVVFSDEQQYTNNYLEDKMLIEKHKDSTVPYKRNYLGYQYPDFTSDDISLSEFEKNLSDKFIAEKRPLSPHKLNEFFNSFINEKNFSENGKIEILKKILEDGKTLDLILEPLNKLKIPYSINITGGAVRDFVLNRENEITDIDFMVNIIDNGNIKTQLSSKYILLSEIFKPKELHAVNWVDDQDIDDLKGKLITMCLNKANIFTELYNINSPTNKTDIKNNNNSNNNEPEIDTGEYRGIARERIYNIIKFKNSESKTLKFNYPFDILLSNMSAPCFLNHFDFDICKASFCITHKSYAKEVPQNPLHLISRFSAPTEFWADVANKQITLNTYMKNEKMLKDSVNTHMPKILKKYQNFRVEINEMNPNATQNKYIGEIKSLIMQNILDKNLEVKSFEKKKNKI